MPAAKRKFYVRRNTSFRKSEELTKDEETKEETKDTTGKNIFRMGGQAKQKKDVLTPSGGNNESDGVGTPFGNDGADKGDVKPLVTDDDKNELLVEENNEDTDRTPEMSESKEEKGTTTDEAKDISPEEYAREKFLDDEVKKKERQSHLDALKEAGINPDAEEKWKRKEQSDKNIARAMTGLRLTADVADRAMGALQSIWNIGKGVFQNPLSSPMGPARKVFVDTIVETGAAVQGLKDDIGKVWGIKDGVKDPKDIAGTYKGAQYYKDHAAVEKVQATFAKDLEYIGREAFGKDFKADDFGTLLLDAVDKGDIATIDKVSRRLRETYQSNYGMEMRKQVNREMADRNNDAIPENEKYKASAEAKAFDTIYRKYLWGATNAAEQIGANANKMKVKAREAGTNYRTAMREQKALADIKAKADKEADMDERRKYLEGQGTSGQLILMAEDVLGKDVFGKGGIDITKIHTDGLPMMDVRTENKIRGALNNKIKMGKLLSKEEQEILDKMEARLAEREKAKAPKKKPKPRTPSGRLKVLLAKDSDGMGGSRNKTVNNEIIRTADEGMAIAKRKYEEKFPDGDWEIEKWKTKEFRKYHASFMSAKASNEFIAAQKVLTRLGDKELYEGEMANLREAREEVARFYGPKAKVDWTPENIRAAEDAYESLLSSARIIKDQAKKEGEE